MNSRSCGGAWVVTDPSSPSDGIDFLADVMQRRWIDEPALAHLPHAGAALDTEALTFDI